MAASTLAFATIEELQPLLAKKRVSPVELANLYLSRIDQIDRGLNAFRTVTAERALADARAAETELLRGKCRGPLHGIPIALKDNIWTRGIRTTAGSAILRDFMPDEDATVARRLRRAGAVLLGKTNMHEFAYGITSENPHYGATNNPWAGGRISGGSSGGSAAAIAAGLCVASIGSDTGGSIRVPAALCGVVGLKPTFGRVSVHGVFPLVPSFDHVGPLARCTADATALLAVIAGRDPRDPTSIAHSNRDLLHIGAQRNKKFRLGRPKEYFWTRLDPQIRRLTEAAVQSMLDQGVTVVEISLPTIESAAVAEASNTVALAEARQVHEEASYFPARASEYGADVRVRLEHGGEVRAVDYIAAQKVLKRSKAEFEAALESVDAIVTPTTPIAAPPIGSERVSVGDAEEPVRSALLRLNRPGNFTGLPAISVPCGFTKEGLPVGLELIGRAFGEATILAIAHQYEQRHEWRTMHPRRLAQLG
jgi:aspartyl-tRNA(Asn)/glutamyl-tRNA(Gln) amidotransferase subunit A